MKPPRVIWHDGDAPAAGVPPIDPVRIARAMGEPGAPVIKRGGEREGYGLRAFLVVTFYAWSALAIVAGLVWAMYRG